MRIGRPSRPPAPRVALPGKKGGPKPKSGNTRGGRSALTTKSLPTTGGKSMGKAGNTRGSRSALGSKDLPLEAPPVRVGGEEHGLGNVRARRPEVLRAQGLTRDGFEPGVGRRVDDRTSAFEVNGRLPTSAGGSRRAPAPGTDEFSPPTPEPRTQIAGGNQLTSRGPIRKQDYDGPKGAGGAA